MFDDDFDNEEDSEPDYYAEIPEDAFYYEESAYKYGFELGQREAEDDIASEFTLENFPYPVDADQSMVEVFKDAYRDAVNKYNDEFAEYRDEEDEWN